MSIQSVTANIQPPSPIPAGTKATTQPEVRNNSQTAEAPRKSEGSQEIRADSREESEKQVREAVENIQKFVAQTTRDITFSIDQEAGFMVKVIDRNSQDVIRQIPSEEVVAIARALDKLQGLFVQDKI